RARIEVPSLRGFHERYREGPAVVADRNLRTRRIDRLNGMRYVPFVDKAAAHLSADRRNQLAKIAAENRLQRRFAVVDDRFAERADRRFRSTEGFFRVSGGYRHCAERTCGNEHAKRAHESRAQHAEPYP